MEAKPKYNKQLFFREEDKSVMDDFDDATRKDPYFQGLGKGKHKFSASLRQIMKDYLDMTSDSNKWKSFLIKIKSNEKIKDKSVGEILSMFISSYLKQNK